MAIIRSMDRISLASNWDHQPKIGEPDRSRHIEREDEHHVLTDFMIRRDEGSLLVCGHRGVGKTSSVIAAINDARQADKKLVPVLIKATSINLDGRGGGKASPKQALLSGLIRSLHRIVKDNDEIASDLKEKTEELFIHSLASEARNEEHSGKIKTAEKTSTVSLNLGLAASIIAPSAIMGLSFALASEPYTYFWMAVPVAVSAIASAHLYKRARIASFSSSVSYYRHDYDFSDLQYEFERLMEGYSDHKVLFVLDEFDKIDNFGSIVKDIKMLINQGNALFVFTTSPDRMSKIREKHGEEYTLFSQILFLKRPLFREMEAFIDSIVLHAGDGAKDDADYKNFRNYLCYESHTDFFEIYQVIRDHIIGKDPDGNPSIGISLDEAQLTKANLQKSIGWVYERKKHSNRSRQQINDEVIDALYEAAEAMEEMPAASNVSVGDDGKIILSGNEIGVRRKEPHKTSAVSDLLLLLARQGYLKQQGQNQYVKIGTLNRFDDAGIFVEEQRTFIEDYERLKERLVDFANIYSRGVEKFRAPFTLDTFDSKAEEIKQKVNMVCPVAFDEAEKSYASLRESPPPLVAVETLQQHTNDIRSNLDLLNKHSLHLLARVLDAQTGREYKVRSDLSGDFFNRKGIQGQDVLNAVSHLQGRYIQNIVVLDSPPTDLLEMIRRSASHNVIICLGDDSMLSRYRQTDFIASDSMGMKKDMRHFFSPAPGRDPGQIENENKTFFLAMRTPLDPDEVKKLTEMIREFFANPQDPASV